MVFYYILLQVLSAFFIYAFFNLAHFLPVVIYPLSVILFGGSFFVSVKVAKTILNTRTVFAVLIEIMVTIGLVFNSAFDSIPNPDLPFMICGVSGIALVATVILFIVYREFSLKGVVWTAILTQLYKGSLVVTYAVFNFVNVTYLGIFGLLLFLAAYFFLKTYGKSPADVKYTATDALVLFIGTMPFIIDLYIGIIAVLWFWSIF